MNIMKKIFEISTCSTVNKELPRTRYISGDLHSFKR